MPRRHGHLIKMSNLIPTGALSSLPKHSTWGAKISQCVDEKWPVGQIFAKKWFWSNEVYIDKLEDKVTTETMLYRMKSSKNK